MKYPVKAPSVGESITEVSILKWHKQNGQKVKSGEVLLEIESDKATVEVVAEVSGSLSIFKPQGERIPVGEQVGTIDDSASTEISAQPAPLAPPPPVPPPPDWKAPTPVTPPASSAPASPAVRKAIAERGLDVSTIPGTGKDGRVTKGDVLAYGAPRPQTAPAPRFTPLAAPAASQPITRSGERRAKMSMLRQRIAERLVQAQHSAAILTTFNEADMTAVMELRNRHKDSFKVKHGVSLGFMSFFLRACVEALKQVPEVNASIDGNDIVYHDYYDIGVAVGTERGLVVPVVRDAEKMGFPEIEKRILSLAEQARTGKLGISDLSGGTFTISNGGVYGSLLSTPILNPPQSGILGMHKIQERPIAKDGKIEIRPMMYLALSYDHRLIDGKGAVTFLVAVKDFIENPIKLNPEF